MARSAFYQLRLVHQCDLSSKGGPYLTSVTCVVMTSRLDCGNMLHVELPLEMILECQLVQDADAQILNRGKVVGTHNTSTSCQCVYGPNLVVMIFTGLKNCGHLI